MDAVSKVLVENAKSDLDAIDAILARAAAGGPRSKPTIAQLNDICTKLANARTFLKAALGQSTGEPAFDAAVQKARQPLVFDAPTIGNA